MPRPYIQLLLVNMLLAALISITVFGAPILPAVAGALGAGALLYVKSRDTRGHETAPAGSQEAAATRDRAAAAPPSTSALHGVRTGG